MYKLMTIALAATLGTGTACSDGVAQPSRAASPTGPTTIQPTLKIVALGDSLTSGHGIGRQAAYPALLEQSLRGAGLPFTVSNHGVSGDTTSDGLRRVGAALAERPQILILALGANDGLRGVPIAEVRRNLQQIIEQAKAAGVTVLLCGMEALPLYGWQYTAEFHRIFPELADQYDLPLVPFLLANVVGNQSMLLPDMVHPNAAGAKVIAANIWPYLQPMAVAVVAAS